jgi:hypothetical protein
MFRPFRLLMLGALAALIYGAFFWVPPDSARDGAFDADVVAAYEAAGWQAVRARQEFAVYFNFVQMLREQHRYTWFRALQAGFYLTRATTSFTSLNSRYERVLPDLEATARIEQAFKHAPFDAAAAAKAQLNWWIARKRRDTNTVERIGALMADEYNLRYPKAGGGTSEAGHLRAQAVKLFDEGGVDPDWAAIRDLLTQSYRALGLAIARPVGVSR